MNLFQSKFFVEFTDAGTLSPAVHGFWIRDTAAGLVATQLNLAVPAVSPNSGDLLRDCTTHDRNIPLACDDKAV